MVAILSRLLGILLRIRARIRIALAARAASWSRNSGMQFIIASFASEFRVGSPEIRS